MVSGRSTMGDSGVKFDSPLRYPGGKASLAEFLARTIEVNGLSGCSYFEPFAGGAGAALHLLRKGIVSELHLNDLDPHITSFWRAVLDEPDRFAEVVLSVPLSIEEWKRQHQIYILGDLGKPFELGFATFYLNRCNRSGIILGAAPIGGYEQAGQWTMDARFYRESLANRILAIGRRRDEIHVTNMDALDFLAKRSLRRDDGHPTFAYLDPPYYSNGSRLYINFYDDRDHLALSRYLLAQCHLKWVMSYDDTDFIRNLYSPSQISSLSLKYSLQRRRRAQEILISPSHVLLATSVGVHDPGETEATQQRKMR